MSGKLEHSVSADGSLMEGEAGVMCTCAVVYV